MTKKSGYTIIATMAVLVVIALIILPSPPWTKPDLVYGTVYEARDGSGEVIGFKIVMDHGPWGVCGGAEDGQFRQVARVSGTPENPIYSKSDELDCSVKWDGRIWVSQPAEPNPYKRQGEGSNDG